MDTSKNKKCQCKFCSHWGPMIDRIRDSLCGEGEALNDFDAFSLNWFHVTDELNHCQAKLDGSWPGWDWIIEEKKKRNLS